MVNKLRVRHYFDAAHQLKDSEQLVTKACARLHGHTYAVIVEAEQEKLNEAGMVIDFKAIKQLIDQFDHHYINDILAQLGYDLQPTAENIAIVIYNEITDHLKVYVSSISVCEGYKGEERASWAIYAPQ